MPTRPVAAARAAAVATGALHHKPTNRTYHKTPQTAQKGTIYSTWFQRQAKHFWVRNFAPWFLRVGKHKLAYGCSLWQCEQTEGWPFFLCFFFVLKAKFYCFRDFSATLTLTDPQKKKKKYPHIFISPWRTMPNFGFPTLKKYVAKNGLCASKLFPYDV